MKPRVKQVLPDGDADKWRVTVFRDGRQLSGIAMLGNCEMTVGRLRPYEIWFKICRKVKELQRDLHAQP